MCETITKEQLYTLIKSNAEFNPGGGGGACQNTTHAKAEMGAVGASVPLAVFKRMGPSWVVCTGKGRMGLGRTIEPRGEKQKPEDRSTSG